MTIDTTNSAQGGEHAQQDQATGQAVGATGGTDTNAAVTIPAELQPAVDRIVADRLRRAQEKWQADQQAKATSEADAAESRRLEDEKRFQELARKHESRAAGLEERLGAMTADLERATTLITSLLEGKKKGLPESMVKLLENKSLFDQFEIADAYLASQPAGGQRATTTPTPQPQTIGQADFVKQAIEKQQKRATENDPYAAMMKR